MFGSLVAEGKAGSIQGRLPLWGFVVKEKQQAQLGRNTVRKTGVIATEQGGVLVDGRLLRGTVILR